MWCCIAQEHTDELSGKVDPKGERLIMGYAPSGAYRKQKNSIQKNCITLGKQISRTFEIKEKASSDSENKEIQTGAKRQTKNEKLG